MNPVARRTPFATLLSAAAAGGKVTDADLEALATPPGMTRGDFLREARESLVDIRALVAGGARGAARREASATASWYASLFPPAAVPQERLSSGNDSSSEDPAALAAAVRQRQQLPAQLARQIPR